MFFLLNKKQQFVLSTILRTMNSHTEPIFKSLSILPLSSLIEYFKIQFMYNFVNGELPGSFEFTWIRNENREGANLRPLLRNHTDIFIPPSRLISTDKFPLFNFPRVWSSFPDSIIKNLTSKSEFNSKLKTFYLNKLSSSYTYMQQITLSTLSS